MATPVASWARAQAQGAKTEVRDGRVIAVYPDGRTEDLGEYEPGKGVIDQLKSAPGKFEDAAFNAIGMTVDEAGPAPNPDDYFDTAEGTAAENYQRAKDLWDRSAAFKTTGDIRDINITAPEAAGPERMTANDPGAIERAYAAQVQRPEDVVLGQLGDVERVAGVDLAASRDVGPVGVSKVNMADTTANQLLTDAAMGNAPSAAEAQLRAGLDKTAQLQLGTAAQARGPERAGARREAMLAIGQGGADVANKAAELRAQEMAEARGALAGFTTSGAQLLQQANNLQAQIDTQIAQGNQAEANRLTVEQGRLRQQAQEINAGATNSRTMNEAELRAGISRGNIDASTMVALNNAQGANNANLANAAASNVRGENLARRQDETDEAYAARLFAHGQAGADRALDVNKTNAGFTRDKDKTQINTQIQEEQTRQQGQGIAGSQAQGAGNAQTAIGGAKLDADTRKYEADKNRENQQKDARTQTKLKIVDTAIKYSDERLKDDIEPEDSGDAVSLADAYRKMGKHWEYKGEDVERSGPMAQDLLDHPLGRKFVHEDDEGNLGIDDSSAQWAVIKGLADQMHALTMRTAKGRKAS